MTQNIMINLSDQLRNSAGRLFGIIIMPTPEPEKATPPRMAETIDEAIAEIKRFEGQARKNLAHVLSEAAPVDICAEMDAARERLAKRQAAPPPSVTEQLQRQLIYEILNGIKLPKTRITIHPLKYAP